MGMGVELKLSTHFDLEEFLPAGVVASDVPVDVLKNLQTLAETILEPVREHYNVPVSIHSGWRPPAKNTATGGAVHSDHLTGCAADFHVSDSDLSPWETNTLSAFDWIRTALDGAYGQLIREDHRRHYGDPGKLWVHVAIPTAKHPGIVGDPNRVLISPAPKQFEPWRGNGA